MTNQNNLLFPSAPCFLCTLVHCTFLWYLQHLLYFRLEEGFIHSYSCCTNKLTRRYSFSDAEPHSENYISLKLTGKQQKGEGKYSELHSKTSNKYTCYLNLQERSTYHVTFIFHRPFDRFSIIMMFFLAFFGFVFCLFVLVREKWCKEKNNKHLKLWRCW